MDSDTALRSGSLDRGRAEMRKRHRRATTGANIRRSSSRPQTYPTRTCTWPRRHTFRRDPLLEHYTLPDYTYFSIMRRSAVYTHTLGIALIRTLVKPGKPSALVTSLRGIRLLCSTAAWFGQLINQRARKSWQAGSQQFGFKQNMGCMEAACVLIALIFSRTLDNKRLLSSGSTYVQRSHPWIAQSYCGDSSFADLVSATADWYSRYLRLR